MSICRECGGKGWRMVGLGGDSEECRFCNGTGQAKVQVQPSKAERDAAAAKVVREALLEVSKLAFNTSLSRSIKWYNLANYATDEELLKLKGLLK